MMFLVEAGDVLISRASDETLYQLALSALQTRRTPTSLLRLMHLNGMRRMIAFPLAMDRGITAIHT